MLKIILIREYLKIDRYLMYLYCSFLQGFFRESYATKASTDLWKCGKTPPILSKAPLIPAIYPIDVIDKSQKKTYKMQRENFARRMKPSFCKRVFQQ